VLLVEQHVGQALKIADRVHVMERGRIVLSGTADEVAGQVDKIEAAYLAGKQPPPVTPPGPTGG
jgi:branched-chain amino acid transport system ATP-binding protein